mmetsp:Transcript_6744/g.19058  ORF Transcript_6744/g.19058 Transcript_6744/m.19058 type:complete len:231 (-) Transcript_6744:548-1240(-)
MSSSFKYCLDHRSSSQTFLSPALGSGSCPSSAAATLAKFPCEAQPGKRPARKVLSPPRVTPRCSSEVAPSLCEGCLHGLFTKPTCASTTPKCLLFWKHSMKVPSSLPRPSSRYSLLSSSRACRRPVSASVMASQTGRFTARKAIMKATMRGGPLSTLPHFARRGTNSPDFWERWGTECQSALSSCSFASSSKAHLLQTLSLGMGNTGGSFRSLANGPSGSSRRYSASASE